MESLLDWELTALPRPVVRALRGLTPKPRAGKKPRFLEKKVFRFF